MRMRDMLNISGYPKPDLRNQLCPAQVDQSNSDDPSDDPTQMAMTVINNQLVTKLLH